MVDFYNYLNQAVIPRATGDDNNHIQVEWEEDPIGYGEI